MARAAEAAGVPVAAGDTKVVERGKADGALRRRRPGSASSRRRSSSAPSGSGPGDRVLVSGTLGDHGMAVMVARGELELEVDLAERHRARARARAGAARRSATRVRWMRDPTRGGLATALNELAQPAGLAVVPRRGRAAGATGGRRRLRDPRHRPALRRERGQARRRRRRRGARTRRSRCSAATRSAPAPRSSARSAPSRAGLVLLETTLRRQPHRRHARRRPAAAHLLISRPPDRSKGQRPRPMPFLASSRQGGAWHSETWSRCASRVRTRRSEARSPIRILEGHPAVPARLALEGHHRRRHARGARDPRSDGLHEDRGHARDHRALHDPDPASPFALFGSSRRLVVGGTRPPPRSCTRASPGSASRGLQPNTPQWVAFASLSALLAAAFLFLARVARLGFLANFLSRTVLVGFLTGVGSRWRWDRWVGCSASRRRTSLQEARYRRSRTQVRAHALAHRRRLLADDLVSAAVLAILIVFGRYVEAGSGRARRRDRDDRAQLDLRLSGA